MDLCEKTASYAAACAEVTAEGRRFCKRHAPANFYYVRSKKALCGARECRKRATFGKVDTSKAIFCAEHAQPRSLYTRTRCEKSPACRRFATTAASLGEFCRDSRRTQSNYVTNVFYCTAHLIESGAGRPATWCAHCRRVEVNAAAAAAADVMLCALCTTKKDILQLKKLLFGELLTECIGTSGVTRDVRLEPLLNGDVAGAAAAHKVIDFIVPLRPRNHALCKLAIVIEDDRESEQYPDLLFPCLARNEKLAAATAPLSNDDDHAAAAEELPTMIVRIASDFILRADDSIREACAAPAVAADGDIDDDAVLHSAVLLFTAFVVAFDFFTNRCELYRRAAAISGYELYVGHSAESVRRRAVPPAADAAASSSWTTVRAVDAGDRFYERVAYTLSCERKKWMSIARSSFDRICREQQQQHGAAATAVRSNDDDHVGTPDSQHRSKRARYK